MRWIGVAFGVLVGQVVPISSACACEPPPACGRVQLLPAEGSAVPANVPALEWFGWIEPGDRIEVSALRQSPDGEVAVEVGLSDHEIIFSEPLATGNTYRLVAAYECSRYPEGSSTEETSFTVGPAAPLPASLGDLKLNELGVGAESVATDRGTCSIEVQASRVEVKLRPSKEAEPWLATLVYETQVDRSRWHPTGCLGGRPPSWLTGSRIGRGIDIVYLSCNAEPGVLEPGIPQGVHRITMQARVAGSTHVLSSTEAEVTLACSSKILAKVTSSSQFDAQIGAAAVVIALLVILIIWRERRRS